MFRRRLKPACLSKKDVLSMIVFYVNIISKSEWMVIKEWEIPALYN